MKASILAAILLWAVPAAAQTNNPIAPPPGQANQFRRQQQIEDFVRDQELYDQSQQQRMTQLQEQIDNLNSPNATRADLNRLQQGLDQLQSQQQLQRLAAERRISQIEQQGDTARRRRWAAQFRREQQTQRVIQQQRLADIEANLSRFRGQ